MSVAEEVATKPGVPIVAPTLSQPDIPLSKPPLVTILPAWAAVRPNIAAAAVTATKRYIIKDILDLIVVKIILKREIPVAPQAENRSWTGASECVSTIVANFATAP